MTAPTVLCKGCNEQISADAEACPHCGEKVSDETRHLVVAANAKAHGDAGARPIVDTHPGDPHVLCKGCGESIPVSVAACPHCGEKLSAETRKLVAHEGLMPAAPPTDATIALYQAEFSGSPKLDPWERVARGVMLFGLSLLLFGVLDFLSTVILANSRNGANLPGWLLKTMFFMQILTVAGVLWSLRQIAYTPRPPGGGWLVAVGLIVSVGAIANGMSITLTQGARGNPSAVFASGIALGFGLLLIQWHICRISWFQGSIQAVGTSVLWMVAMIVTPVAVAFHIGVDSSWTLNQGRVVLVDFVVPLVALLAARSVSAAIRRE